MSRPTAARFFSDEIGDIPWTVQAKILRVLQERQFERLGSNETVRIDVRVLCATNRNLEQAIAAGGFREDLYHRLNVVTLQLPPLRERRDDIPALVDYFLNRYARAAGIERPPLAQNALEALVNYSWPGNVRELEHLIQRLMIFAGGYTIQADDLPWILRTDASGGWPRGSAVRRRAVAHADPRAPCLVHGKPRLRGIAGEGRKASDRRGPAAVARQPDACRPAAGTAAADAARPHAEIRDAREREWRMRKTGRVGPVSGHHVLMVATPAHHFDERRS